MVSAPGQTEVERPFLSIVVPAYNEEMRLADSLREINAYCETRAYGTEIIVADDGSTDTTPEIVRREMATSQRLRLLSVEHGGKGHACRSGVLAARGDWILFTDTDLSVPIVTISDFERFLGGDYDVVIASREVAGAKRVGEPQGRHLMGRVFNWLVRLVVVSGIRDTQCGFKFFRRQVAAQVFVLQTVGGWGFDVELLYASRALGHRVVEIPVTWYYRSHSKVSPLRDSIRMFSEVCQVRCNAWRGRYQLPPGSTP